MMSNDQQDQNEEIKPINNTTWFLRIAVAVMFDTLKLCFAFLDIIPGLGTTLNIMLGWFAFATFWLWFELSHEKYSKKTILAGFAVNFIPFIGDFAETGTMIRLYVQAKAGSLVAKVEKKVKPTLRPKQNVVNGSQFNRNKQEMEQRKPIRQPTRPMYSETTGEEIRRAA